MPGLVVSSILHRLALAAHVGVSGSGDLRRPSFPVDANRRGQKGRARIRPATWSALLLSALTFGSSLRTPKPRLKIAAPLTADMSRESKAMQDR